MNWSRIIVRGLTVCTFIALLGILILPTGCASGGSGANKPGRIGVLPNHGQTDTTYSPGDKVIIEFDNGLPANWQQVVREDGSISLPLITDRVLIAAGKRKGELEEEIRKIYVPSILRRLTVNIRSEERSYFVNGEVRTPGQKPHTGLITAVKAVAAAGGFTDFAKRTDVEIIRANGEVLHVNINQALKDPSLDVPVYPGDTVHVNRRFF